MGQLCRSQCSLAQHVHQHSCDECGIESTPTEHSGEPPILHVARESTHRLSSVLDDFASRGEFRIPIDAGQSTVDLAAFDSSRLQFSSECTTGQVTALLTRGDPVTCKPGVVEQTDLLQSV